VRLENVWFINCTFHAYNHVVEEARHLRDASRGHARSKEIAI
jgi:hypothetical protein